MKKVLSIVLAAVLVSVAGSWVSWPGDTVQVAYAQRGHGGGGGNWHGGGHRHGGGFRGDFWFGPGWWWDPFYYPYYPYYPYYTPPTVVVPQQPQEYVMPESQPQEPNYWYYCKDSKAYYPYVKRCPGGWMKVVPTPTPSGEE